MRSTTFLPHLYFPSYWLQAERAFQAAHWDDHSYSIILTTPHSRASLSLFKLLCTPTANSPLRSELSTQHSLPCIRSSISQTDLNYYPRPSLMTYSVSPRLLASVRRAPRCLLTPLRGYGALRIRPVSPSIVLSTSTEGTDPTSLMSPNQITPTETSAPPSTESGSTSRPQSGWVILPESRKRCLFARIPRSDEEFRNYIDIMDAFGQEIPKRYWHILFR